MTRFVRRIEAGGGVVVVRIGLGLLFLLTWALYAGQLLVTIDFALAQRLGLAERPADSDPLFNRLELATARWDMVSLWVLPAAGVLMLLDHSWWPYVAMIGGAAFADAGGREAAKASALRDHGVRTGTSTEIRRFQGLCAFLVAVGGLAIGVGLVEAL